MNYIVVLEIDDDLTAVSLLLETVIRNEEGVKRVRVLDAFRKDDLMAGTIG